MKNRALENIEKGIEKGENFFILYGEYIHDWILYDLYNGVLSIRDIYCRHFLNEYKYDNFIYCKNSIFTAYKVQGNEIRECNDIFDGSYAEGDDADGLDLEYLDESEDTREAVSEAAAVGENTADNTGNSEERNEFIRFVELCKNNKNKKYVIFLEDYEWTIGAYKSNNDSSLDYVEKIKEISSLKNTLVIISIEKAEMLEEYNFKIDGNNVFMLGSPSSEELYYTYLRKYMRQENRSEINTVFFGKLREISEAVASGEKSLIESLRIFDRVLTENNGRLELEYFENSLDKQIEEKVMLSDVILDEDVKESIVTRVDEFLASTDVSTKGKGLILTGPPGTGKTFLVKALANEKNCYFMSPSLADLKGEYVGQTSPKVKRLFQKARANSPTIIFLDEADTIFPERDSSISDSDSFMKDMVNQFLVEIDGMLSGNSENKVFVIAATNRIGVLDSAIRSRLGEPIEIPLPNKAQRRAMFTGKLKKEGMDFGKFIFTDIFLDKTNHMSGRDIKNFISQLNTQAKRRNKNISDYTDEAETRALFNLTLSEFESSMIMDLQAKLRITIQKPQIKPDYDSIIGCEKAKRVMDRQIEFFDVAKREQAEMYGIKPKKGVLLYGPPGNGKSQLAEACANQHNLYFMKVTSDKLTKALLSEQSQILVDIFSGAMQISEMCSKQDGVLLFFDEFDSLVSSVGLNSQIRGTLLKLLDDEKGMRNPRTHVIFIAATNHIEELDEASVRAGRIDDKVMLENPTENEGEIMVKQFISQHENVEAIDDKTAKAAYSDYKSKYVERMKARERRVNELIFLQKGYTERDIKEYLDIKFKNTRPSGADLRNYTDTLIETAYYSNSKITGENGRVKLRITDEIIKSVSV